MNAIATAETTSFELLSSAGECLALPGTAGDLLLRMFADPYLLQPQEREVLVSELCGHVAAQPRRAELRVLLGMALCVALLPEQALEELREAVLLAPEFFLAHLKLGELYMRLRIMEQAAVETEIAGRLAGHPAQRELARRQAKQIRGMRRHGILRTAFAFSSRSWLPWTPGRRALGPVPARKEGTRSCLPT